ncbi:mitochondrial import inner membrane translocase subunit TIM50-C [Tribolium castaneum]|uniref:Mitochondrial import inner membrane translocase subunit TIM50 n=1 Tax=Tribolium castaneum TaxID=7070 RepID=D6WUM7_TRICA|nr:PREDICTED: mitochondrial import inner membrane translocase subunit TIM50-C [Tribolium castaneum]EFA08496.1 Mitochondrial import inner membrane translocase subunit TIM50-C-like Protein [Tribolium castaneum]|eukprot:XP_973121.1 PREDICTED: mitochondrial import inner membrane translocase subunit TIM50-C [Tribolium castaneum]
MYRSTFRTLNVFSNLFRHKTSLILTRNGPRVLFKSPLVIIQHRNYAEDAKKQPVKSPLGSLIAKETNEKANSEEEEARKQREASWRTMKLTLIFFGVSFTCLGSYLIFVLGAPERDREGRVIEDDLSHLPLWRQYLMRTYRELDNYRRLIKEPSRDKLLPDPLQYPYLQPKYTLVLELTDVLVHPDWTYNTGWRFKKRPGLDYFLESLHGHFEIVVYTAEQGMTVFPLIEAMDPKNLISYKLVRDATHFVGGHHVKSLDKLNRDLSKVIVVDWNPNSVQFHPENLLKVRRWEGADEDLSLVDLSIFLKTIVDNNIEDVREVLLYYSKYDDPIEAFREKQKKLMELLEAQGAKKKEQEAKPRPWVPTIFSRKQF